VHVIVIHLYPTTQRFEAKWQPESNNIMSSNFNSQVGILLTPDADVAGAESKQWISVQAIIVTSRYFAKQQGSRSMGRYV
jgi:hypothetical protein